jgi:hypothetical protein
MKSIILWQSKASFPHQLSHNTLNLPNLNHPLPPLRVLNPIDHIVILLVSAADAQRANTDALLGDALGTSVPAVGDLAFMIAADGN